MLSAKSMYNKLSINAIVRARSNFIIHINIYRRNRIYTHIFTIATYQFGMQFKNV